MRIIWIIILVLACIRCSSKTNSADTENLKEEFPAVNLEDYDTIKLEDEFQFIVLKDLTESKNESQKAMIGYSHFSKEKHIYVECESISNYKRSLKARKKGYKDILSKYAKEHLKDFKGVLKKSSTSSFEESEVNGLMCLRNEFYGDCFGFPRTKSFTFRYFQGEEHIYTLVCWTIKDSKSKFEKEALAMGLSLKEI